MRKKLRVVLILLMAVVMSIAACIGLGGCSTYKGKFFDKQHLEEHLIPDLPKPSFEIQSDGGSSIWYKVASDSEKEDYIKSIYNYLMQCNFEWIGTEGIEFRFLQYDVILCSELDEFKKEHTETDESGEIVAVYVTYSFVWGYGKSDSHCLDVRYAKGKTWFCLELCHTLAHYYMTENE